MRAPQSLAIDLPAQPSQQEMGMARPQSSARTRRSRYRPRQHPWADPVLFQEDSGTSDTFKTLLNWKGKTEREDQWETLLVANLEGGFDKVNTEIPTGGDTALDP